MNKILSSLAIPMFAFFIVQHNAQWNIVKRLDNGTLEQDSIRVYTNLQTGDFYSQSHKANMREMRMYKATWNCAPGGGTDKSNCKKANPLLQTAN